jgi:hypothetical protein
VVFWGITGCGPDGNIKYTGILLDNVKLSIIKKTSIKQIKSLTQKYNALK